MARVFAGRAARHYEENGLADKTVCDAIDRLNRAGVLVVERRGNGKSNNYTLPHGSGSESEPVQRVNRFRNYTTGGSESEPEAVQRVNPKKKRSIEKNNARKIVFDAADGDFVGITPADLTRWGAAFPGVNIQAEILEAANWLISKNQTRDDYRRYLLNLFKRCKPTPAEPTGDYIEDPDTIEQIYKEAGLC